MRFYPKSKQRLLLLILCYQISFNAMPTHDWTVEKTIVNKQTRLQAGSVCYSVEKRINGGDHPDRAHGRDPIPLLMLRARPQLYL